MTKLFSDSLCHVSESKQQKFLLNQSDFGNLPFTKQFKDLCKYNIAEPLLSLKIFLSFV